MTFSRVHVFVLCVLCGQSSVPPSLPRQGVHRAPALIRGEPPADLRKRLDLPWYSAEEFYVRKIALTLDAAAGDDGVGEWIDVAP